MINHKYKCIFVHIIKTGGVSICRALRMKDDQLHIPASKIKSITQDKWDKYFSFSFTRNPWDKMVSQYFYNGQCYTRDFNKYIDRWYNDKEFVTSHSCIHNDYLDIDIDFIGRFENLQDDFDFICNKVGKPKTILPHKNSKPITTGPDGEKVFPKPKGLHYSSFYNDSSVNMVAEKFSKDIDLFNYEFDKS
jgi:hypothetical protein